jgi:hypothetical protein
MLIQKPGAKNTVYLDGCANNLLGNSIEPVSLAHWLNPSLLCALCDLCG